MITSLAESAQKKVKIAFENADSSLRVKLIPSKINGGNLQSVHKTLPDRLQNLSLGFNPKSDIPNRAWTTKDQDCIVTILKKIDVVLLKRRIMRSLEVLVSGKTTKTESYDPIIL
nr:hypothetical protein [Tanacetum cinerariifolium]